MRLNDDFEEFDGFFFDCDGVLWEENHLLPGAKELLDVLNLNNKQVAFLSNNSTKSISQYLEKFQSFKLPVTEKQVITSSVVTLKYIEQKNYKMKRVYVIGEHGLQETFSQNGFEVVLKEEANKGVDAVIVGMDRAFSYEKLSTGLRFCLRGADFIGTNPDPQFPTPKGNFPGAGSMIGALQSALGYPPLKICGKPDPLMATIMLNRFDLKSEKTLFIGDRVITDMNLALRANLKPVLVKTGFGAEEFEKYPTFSYFKVIDSLKEFLQQD